MINEHKFSDNYIYSLINKTDPLYNTNRDFLKK